MVVWALLCVATIGFGRQALALALPLFDRMIAVLQGDFAASVEIAQDGTAQDGKVPDAKPKDSKAWVLRMQPTLVRPAQLNAELAMPAGTRLRWFVTHVDHTLVPPLLFLMVLLGWPADSRAELRIRLLSALPMLLLILALTAPVQLVGQVQMVQAELAALAGEPRGEPPLVTLMVFMESGGRWLLPLVAGILCIALGRKLRGPSQDSAQAGPGLAARVQ